MKASTVGALDRLLVRPITRSERDLWEQLMVTHHYLGSSAVVGEALRYVGTLDEEWVALLAWGSAALKSRHRDTWIGWKPGVQWSKLKLVANNLRFLILPAEHRPNLASKVLSLNTKRLSGDWERIHGHPVLLAETFVDPRRFAGTCYKAAGWVELGKTQGFAKNSMRYEEHGEPKAIFIRPLARNAAELLSDPAVRPGLPKKRKKAMKSLPIAVDDVDDLLLRLRMLPESRKTRGMRHSQMSILAITICAILSGCRHYTAIAEWAEATTQKMRQRLRCRRDPKTKRYVAPSEATIRRVLQGIDANRIDAEVCAWVRRKQTGKRQAIAFDGKTLRGSGSDSRKPVHLLGAFLQEQALVINQHSVSEKSNEIPALPAMLKTMDVEGMVITADAMHTQTKTAKVIVEEKKADYVFVVKDNQATLHDDLRALQLEAFPPSVSESRKRSRPD